VNRTGGNSLTPGQNYRQDVAVPHIVFTQMFLLSQRWCTEAPCHGVDRRFGVIHLVVLKLSLFGV